MGLVSSSTLLTIAGLLFDFFQVSLSLADVVSDILVAIEFKQNDHTVFFALVLTTLSITSIVNGVMFGNRMGLRFDYYATFGEDLKVLGAFILLSIFGLLLPPLNYLFTKTGWCLSTRAWSVSGKQVDWGSANKPEDERDADQTTKINNVEDLARSLNNGKNRKKNNNTNVKNPSSQTKQQTAASSLFFKKIAPQHATLSLLDQAVVDRILSFFLMNLQCATESVPEIVIQLVAISIFQSVTPLQIISLTLSMFSVVCKAFQLTRSFCTKAFFAKIFFLAHDLFSMAFIFSVLLATNTPRTSNFFFLSDELSPFKINPVSNVWLLVKIVLLGVWAIHGIFFWIYQYRRAFDKTEFVKASVLVGFIGAVVAIPALLIHELCKLSWLVGFNYLMSPDPQSFPKLSILHEFLHGSSSPSSSFCPSCCGFNNKLIFPSIDWAETFAALARKIRFVVEQRDKEVSWERWCRIERFIATRDREIRGQGQHDPTIIADNDGKQEDDSDEDERNDPNKSYITPFIEISTKTKGEVVVKHRELLAICQRPFTCESLATKNKKVPDLSNNILKKSWRLMTVKGRPNSNGNPSEGSSDDDSETSSSSSSEEDNPDDLNAKIPLFKNQKSKSDYSSISATEPLNANNSNNNKDDSNIDCASCTVERISDNFQQRARHITLVQRFFAKCERATSKNSFDDEYKGNKKILRNFDKFIDGADFDRLADPYEQRSVFPFIFKGVKDVGDFFRQLCELFTCDENSAEQKSCCEDPIPLFFLSVYITNLISVTVALVFPIVYAILYWEHFAVMQTLCFYSAMICLFFSLLLGRSFLNYQFTCQFYEMHVRWCWGMNALSAQDIFTAIDSYFSMPIQLLASYVNAREGKENPNQNSPSPSSSRSIEAIPEDCFEQHVLIFLTTKQTGLSGLLEDDFDQLQESIFAK